MREKDCGKKELLLSYLYDEANQHERTDFAAHLTACSSCDRELQAFQGVRQELSTWQIPFVPHIEVITPRSATDALREFFRLLPGWFKVTSGLAAAAAAALVVFAISGTQIKFGQEGFTAQVGVKEIVQPQIVKEPTTSTSVTPSLTANTISRAEAEKMIQVAVAQAQAQTQAQAHAQFAALEAKLNSAHQANLANATMRLQEQQQKNLNAVLAEGRRGTLTEWLFASAETGTENQEQKGNENNN